MTIKKDLEGSGHGLFQDTIPLFLWKDIEKKNLGK
jgi:hypothetical protein